MQRYNLFTNSQNLFCQNITFSHNLYTINITKSHIFYVVSLHQLKIQLNKYKKFWALVKKNAILQ